MDKQPPAENGSFAVFLDRDGVINRRRSDHVKSWAEFEFLPGALTALAALHQVGVRVVVVTNQAAVGRGLLGEEDLERIHEQMRATVAAAGGRIEAIYACLHAPEAACACRKPAPDLFRRASAELGIPLNGSVMVGDAPTDVQAAQAVGCQAILLTEDSSLNGDDSLPVVRSLAEAVGLLTERGRQGEEATCS